MISSKQIRKYCFLLLIKINLCYRHNTGSYSEKLDNSLIVVLGWTDDPLDEQSWGEPFSFLFDHFPYWLSAYYDDDGDYNDNDDW